MQITGGKGSQLVALDTSEAGSSCAIYLSEANSSIARWRIRLQADLNGNGSFTDVGTFVTSPPTATSPKGSPARMVAAACMPGAKGWQVLVTLANPEDGIKAQADINLSSYEGIGHLGLVRTSERYAYIAGSSGASTTVTIKVGQRVTTWAAISDGAAATVTIAGGNTISIPATDSVEGNPDGTLQGKFDFVFTHCDYFIEYLESA